ncbi:trypsin-like peptidase domain-containing protein [Pseudomonas entomophila]|nr:trypsin-like peptidase domain-containing protein [Pseudomonas entomophila]
MRPLKSLLAATMLLSGCNGMPLASHQDPSLQDQAFVVHSGGPVPLLMMGSAVQWNEDYAITVKHLPFVGGSEFQGRGDVQFFRHKAKQALPLWRSYQPGESLTAVGFNAFYLPMQGHGQALPALVRLDAKDGGVMYATHDGPTVVGMSGGPVFAADGSVVGINVANLDKGALSKIKRPDLAGRDQVSIFLPYAQIQREWQRFANLQAGIKSTPAPTGLPVAAAH